MKLFNSFNEIYKQLPKLSDYIPDHEQYLAHTPSKNDREKEGLLEHIEKVNDYALHLIHVHVLDPVIDKLIYDMINTQPDFHEVELMGNYIKMIFFQAIIFHDYGKINPNFQNVKMGNLKFIVDKSIIIDSQHSKLSAYIFIHYCLKDIAEKFEDEVEKSFLWALVFLFSNTILKHHAGYIENDIDFDLDVYTSLQTFLAPFNLEFENSFEYFTGLEKNEESEGMLDYFEKYYASQNYFSIFALLKLNFSLLTASDYLATNEYMTGQKIEDFGVLSQQRIKEIFNNIQTHKSYNKKSYENLSNYEFVKPLVLSNSNLNILRQEMAIEVIQNIRSNADKTLFYIEAPTGGGKTNLSMLATVELLKADLTLNKVFYIFPFTTLITQTHKSIIETLGLNEDEIIQLHSKAGFKTKDYQDDLYGSYRKNYIENLFANYPFVLITHIKFFDVLKGNDKESNYLLHRLANSIIVLDELQTYNPAHWDKVIYFIRNYAHFFNMKFIIMSATLPKLDKINLLKGQVEDFVYLLANPKIDYFQNPNFSNRVNFKFDLLDKNDLTLDGLADKILELSEIYSKIDLGESKPAGSIYTIVEFIFKKTATEFSNIVKTKADFFDEIFVLSGTILEHRRRYIINFLKNPLNRKKKILLITTQVVEAGVDIDMDLGFKNKSIPDSDEQLAGRINRNVNKLNCELYLFKINEPSVLYNKDQRYQMTNANFNQSDYQDILKTKNFDKIYDLVFTIINADNGNNFKVNLSSYLNKVKSLNFQSIAGDFKLIEENNFSIFVPLKIPVFIEGAIPSNKDYIFSQSELNFLNKAGICPDGDNKIDGEKIFQFYIEVIHNQKSDFIEQKVNLKILAGIMSKYCFSIFATIYDKEELLKYATNSKKNEYGFIYLEAYQSIYNENTGLKLGNNDSVII